MSTKVLKSVLAALTFAAVTVLAYAQTDQNTTTTSAKYRIALIEPVEGSSIDANQVRVILTPNANAMGDDKTQVDVFLDDQQKGTLRTGETEFRVAGVRPGPHKLVLIARNPVTDAQFDRREINFVATGPGTTTGVSSVTENTVGAHVPPAVSSTERQHSYTANDGTQTQVAENTTASSTSASTSTQSSSTHTYSTNPPPPPSSSSSSSSAYSNNTYSNNPGSSYAPPPSTSGGTDRSELEDGDQRRPPGSRRRGPPRHGSGSPPNRLNDDGPSFRAPRGRRARLVWTRPSRGSREPSRGGRPRAIAGARRPAGSPDARR
jgi:hypothetical protein